MSRIGKQPIEVPAGTEIKIDRNLLTAKGPRGQLSQFFAPEINVELKGNNLQIMPVKNAKNTSALWGLTRALIFNIIKGVNEGFEKKLEIQGIGYRVALQGNKLVLNIGFSHPVEIEAPSGIEFKIDKNIIIVSGADKQLVGQTAANIRNKRKPEPYKGKGIRYLGEIVRRKAGKKAVASQ